MPEKISETAALTPIQRALELKRAAQGATSAAPKTGRANEKAAAARSASKSKPALRK